VPTNRLITFLGTGNYTETVYTWRDLGEATRTRFVAVALAELTDANHIDVLATTEASAKHGDALQRALNAGKQSFRFHQIRTGRNDDGRWQQFRTLSQLIQQAAEEQERVVLDITHGFRAQPFFAGATLDVLLAAGIRPAGLRVVYGEHVREGDSTIWELTQFIELTEWAQALAMFTRTGFAGPVVALGRRMRKSLAAQIQQGQVRPFPQFGSLIDAIEAFANDLSTVRIASIITGYAQDDGNKLKAFGSAHRLEQAISGHRDEVAQLLPPLALVLDQLHDSIQSLIAKKLSNTAGQAAMSALANHYLDRERYPEAMVVAREARVSLHATDKRACEVNAPEFSAALRRSAERRFAESDPEAQTIGDVRNDIEHGGFRAQPKTAAVLQKCVRALLETRPPDSAARTARCSSSASTPPRTWLVSRHPGAREWLLAQNLKIDTTVAHLDPEQVNAGDRVIGTLPLHLAADLCARSARVLFLALDIPAVLRGVELDRHQMEQCKARLEEFHVERIAVEHQRSWP